MAVTASVVAIVEEYFTVNMTASKSIFLCDMLAARTGSQAVVNKTISPVDEVCVPAS
jgi:hypothetical protein